MKKSICIIVLIIISFGSSLKTSAKEIEPVFYVKAESGETIYCADLSPDGKYIVAGFYKDIRLFDVSTGNIINKFAGYKEPIQNVFFFARWQENTIF
jgi:WD40 repeat protein